MYEKEGTLPQAAPSDAAASDPIPEACAQPLPESLGPLSDGNAEAENPPPLEAPSAEIGRAVLQEDCSAPTEGEDPIASADEAEAGSKAPMGEDAADPAPLDGIDEEAMEAPALFADPLPRPDPDPGIPRTEDPTDRLDALRGELTRMEQRLQMQEKRFASLGKECEEFGTLYPDVPLSSLPESVWKATREGVPLAAAYALEERRRIHAEEQARRANLQNRQRSTGELRPAANDFFSPAEVRAMSTAEVRANYQSIMRSMQKWH